MDGQRFDRLARALAGTQSRRGILGGLAAGAGAGILSALGLGGRSAAQEGCAEGLVDCGGACVDLASSPFNCGACGRECFGGESPGGICAGGICGECPPGLTACYAFPDGYCADLAGDERNCGICGQECPSGGCVDGVCVREGPAAGCPEGQTNCGGDCTDLTSDSLNCGGCGQGCSDGASCVGGVCQTQDIATCAAGQAVCDGICTDLTTAENCGGCGRGCFGANQGAICRDGECQGCPSGLVPVYADPAGICVDLATDPTNCGLPEVVCESGICEGGVCVPSDEVPPGEPTETPAEPEETAPPAVAVDEPTATAAATEEPVDSGVAGGLGTGGEATTTPASNRSRETETPSAERPTQRDETGTVTADAQTSDRATSAARGGGRCPATTEDENEALARRWYEDALNRGDPDALDGLLAPDVVHHAATFADATGPEDVKGTLGALLAGFPDYRARVEQAITEDDLVVLRWTATGTHEGEFQGLRPTGQEATWTGINVFRIECGRIAEVWSEADGLGRLRQLGALATPTPRS